MAWICRALQKPAGGEIISVMNVNLGSPLMLLSALPAACVLAVCWALALRRRRGGNLGMLLRGLIATLLALGAAGLAMRSGGRPRAMIILDRSSSMGTALEAARKSAKAAGQVLSERFEVRYASFAASARAETAASLENVATDASGTDLCAAFEHALAEMRPGEPVLILTDGRAALPELQAVSLRLGADSPQLVLLPAGPRSPDAALAALDLPARAHPGELLPILVSVTGNAAEPVQVRLLRSVPGKAETEVDSAVVQLGTRGANTRLLRFEDRAPQAGRVEYRVELRAASDAESGNNAARAFLTVLGPIRVGFLTRTTMRPAELLSTTGLRVSSLRPEDLARKSGEFDVLVLENLPRAALSRKRRDGKRLAGFVRAGGGLVMLGGPQAYASGGYYDGGTLEKALPASMRPPDERGLFAVLVLDRSGSMGHRAGGRRSKLDMVKEAAGAIADRDAFAPRDRLAVVVFDATARLLAEPVAPASERAAAALRTRLAGIKPGGSTNLVGALEKALAVVNRHAERDSARHVILLSDGLPVGSGKTHVQQKARLLQLAARMAAAGTTLSTVGTGSEEEDAALLAALAGAGRGRFHRPTNLNELAEVFRQDLSARRAKLIEKPFTPLPGARPMPGLPEKLPQLEARNRISARKDAWVALSAPGSSGRGPEPLLVAWERGRGRAACFASGAGNPWNQAALSGATGRRFMTALVRWAAGRSSRQPCRLELNREADGRFRLELIVTTATGKPIDSLAPLAQVRGLAAPVPLLQSSPSRYSARLVLPAEEREIVATVRDRDRGELAREVFAVSYPRELARVGVDLTQLRALARMTGATMISSPAQLKNLRFKRTAGRGWKPLSTWLIAGALLLILAELALRAVRR
jgi:Ca-activated chloride channel homolog